MAPDGAATATQLLLERHPRLTAIFVHSDVMAIGVYDTVAASGRHIPDDVAIVSCDDIPFARCMTPSLTSMHIPFAETGARAVEVLIQSINGGDVAVDASLLPVELIVRASSGAVPTLEPSEAGGHSAKLTEEVP